MKKYLFATVMAAGILTFAGCMGGTATVETPDFEEDFDEVADDDFEEEPTEGAPLYDDDEPSEGAPLYDDDEPSEGAPLNDFDMVSSEFLGTWVCDQQNYSILISADGSWKETNYMGDIVENGYLIQTGDSADFYDMNGNFYKTLSLIDGGLFDNFEQVSFSQSDIDLTYTGSEYEPGILWGVWDYQEIEPGESYDDYRSVGTLTIDKHGLFTYETFDGYVLEGTITIEFDDYGDGNLIPYYSFHFEDNTTYFSFYCEQNDPDIYYEGNGGMARIVRE